MKIEPGMSSWWGNDLPRLHLNDLSELYVLSYDCKLQSGVATINDEADAIDWFSLSEVPFD
jgi:hypothetical protein